MIERTCSRCSSNAPRPPQQHLSPKFLKSITISVADFLKVTVIVVGVLAASSLRASQEIEYRTLPQLIETGTQSLARRDYQSAATAFNAILDNYRDEAVWAETDLPSKILPLAGYTSHKANLHPAAVEALTEFLDTQNPNTDTQLFARYTLASSLLKEGKTEQANEAFKTVRKLAGPTPFRDLSLIRQAQLSEPKAAISLLQELLFEPYSPRLANHARLELARLFIEAEDYESACFHILDTVLGSQGYYELARRSYLASEIAAKIEEVSPEQALRCYQAIASKADLINSLETNIHELRTAFRNLAPKLRTEQSMWIDHYRNAISILESQLDAIRESDDYTDLISLRKARCFVRMNRPLEAWILLESLVVNQSESARLAHLDWISIARSMKAWQASAVIAKAFIVSYPDDKHVPQTLFLIALAQIEQEQHLAAINSLQSVQDTQPSPELLASCHYYKGFCFYQLSRFENAIRSFSEAVATNPDSLLAAQATIWIGLCHFSSFEIDPAIAAFDSVLANDSWKPLHPEATYRKAATLFAAGELAQSKTTLADWNERYSPHEREAEVYLLSGDIFYESGEAAKAIEAYRMVQSFDTEILHDATMKLATIYQSSGDFHEALNSLITFETQNSLTDEIASKHFLLKARILTAAGQANLATQELDSAIKTFGPRLKAEGLLELVLARYRNASVELKALANLPPSETSATLLARYRVAFARLTDSQGNSTQAKRIRLSLVSDFPIAQLPPEALIDAGNALLQIDSQETPKYFEALLKSFPNSEYSDASHLGLAKFLHSQDRHEAALTHLESIAFPSPDSNLVRLNIETALNLTSDAQKTAEAILSERRYPPHAKAKALVQLGRIALESGESEKAYTYFQRIFTLYRGERESVAHAYLQCGKILYSQSRYDDSRGVLTEMVSQTDLSNFPEATEAKELLNSLPQPVQELTL